MKPSEEILLICWAFDGADSRRQSVRDLSRRVSHLEVALVGAYDDSGVCPMCGEHDHAHPATKGCAMAEILERRPKGEVAP